MRGTARENGDRNTILAVVELWFWQENTKPRRDSLFLDVISGVFFLY